MDIKYNFHPGLSISQRNLIERVLIFEQKEGLPLGSMGRYLNNPQLSDDQQGIIYMGLMFEILGDLEPGTIVEEYASLSYEEMCVKLRCLLANIDFSKKHENTLNLTQ